jgi:hypothetical protein
MRTRGLLPRSPGNGEAMIERIWEAATPMSTTSPITSIVTAAQVD